MAVRFQKNFNNLEDLEIAKLRLKQQLLSKEQHFLSSIISPNQLLLGVVSGFMSRNKKRVPLSLQGMGEKVLQKIVKFALMPRTQFYFKNFVGGWIKWQALLLSFKVALSLWQYGKRAIRKRK